MQFSPILFLFAVGGSSGSGEVSNLVRIHGSTLGQSAPSLSNTMVSEVMCSLTLLSLAFAPYLALGFMHEL